MKLQRVKEALNKYEKAVESALGNRRRDMFEVVHLATAPVSQGHGYATKLVRMVTAMVRAEWHPTLAFSFGTSIR